MRRPVVYEMRYDAEHGSSLEITFQTNPPVAVRDALKALDFRWHKVKKCWYGYQIDGDTVRAVIDHATHGGATQGKVERRIKRTFPAETPSQQ